MFSREVDTVFLCETCGTMHVRSNGHVEEIDYEFGTFTNRTIAGDRIYLPFWVLDIQFDISDISIQGGGLGNLFGILGDGQARSGKITMYVPAYEMDPQHFKEVAMYHTGNPPKYQPGKPEPGVPREKTSVTADLLPQMADFIFVTGIAEKPGVLQRLDYELNILRKRMIYLPFFKKGGGFQSGYD